MKCITFDKEAQDNLPQHIKDKMKADRDKAIKEREAKVLNIPDVSISLTDMQKEKDRILKLTKKSTKYPPSVGGQICGIPTTTIVLENEAVGLKLELSCHRSQLKNLDLGMQMIELAIMELVK